jgi:hypothetical protein
MPSARADPARVIHPRAGFFPSPRESLSIAWIFQSERLPVLPTAISSLQLETTRPYVSISSAHRKGRLRFFCHASGASKRISRFRWSSSFGCSTSVLAPRGHGELDRRCDKGECESAMPPQRSFPLATTHRRERRVMTDRYLSRNQCRAFYANDRITRPSYHGHTAISRANPQKN